MKIAFIDHTYHKKTKSSAFFIDIINQGNNIEFFYWDDDSEEEDIQQIFSDINTNNFDCVIFWQVIPSYKSLCLLTSNNIIFVPMYDACHNWKYFQWYGYRQFRFISFSKTLHDKLSEMGIVSFYIQYMPALPENFSQENIHRNNHSVFLWNRNGSIQINKVLSFIYCNQWNKIIIHEAPDPNMANRQNMNINIGELQIEKTTWFKNQFEYIQKVTSCDVYISPRGYEGIGLSFLEAMRMGLCVVAKNNPTMNEYIENGINGILFNNYKELEDLKIQNLISIKENAFKKSNDIYKEYRKKIPLLLQFIFCNFEKNTIQHYTVKFLIKDTHLFVKQCYKALLRRIKII